MPKRIRRWLKRNRLDRMTMTDVEAISDDLTIRELERLMSLQDKLQRFTNP